MTADVRLKGATEFRAAIRRAEKDMADLREPLQRSATEVANDARALAPRVTGRLAASLVATATRERAQVSSQLVYAPVIHYGWRGHNIEPQPFLTTALAVNEREIVNRFDREAEHAVDLMAGDYT